MSARGRTVFHPHAEKIGAALDAARARDGRGVFIGEAELYCEQGDCPIRTVTLVLKEHDGPTPTTLTCPACRSPLKLHHVLTLAEQEAAFQREARASVNMQRYVERERRAGGARGLVAVPIGVLLDDSLPGMDDGA